jgi:hypothetical protein
MQSGTKNEVGDLREQRASLIARGIDPNLSCLSTATEEQDEMAKGDAFWKAAERKDALKSAEASGQVADSMEVRKGLVERFERGDITFEQMQAELAAIKRNAKKNGQITRDQAYTGRA